MSKKSRPSHEITMEQTNEVESSLLEINSLFIALQELNMDEDKLSDFAVLRSVINAIIIRGENLSSSAASIIEDVKISSEHKLMGGAA